MTRNEKALADLAENKIALVAAHRAKDWATAKALSARRQLLKKRICRFCVVCGCAISNGSYHSTGKPTERCKMHDRRHLYYGRRLPDRKIVVAK